MIDRVSRSISREDKRHSTSRRPARRSRLWRSAGLTAPNWSPDTGRPSNHPDTAEKQGEAMKVFKIILYMASMLCAVDATAQMTVHHINVGQADATLLEFRTAAILIDAGGSNTGDDRDQEHLISYLDSFFQRRGDLERTLSS